MRMVSRAVAGLSFVSIVWAAGLHAQGWTPLAGVSNAERDANEIAGVRHKNQRCRGDMASPNDFLRRRREWLTQSRKGAKRGLDSGPTHLRFL